MIEGFKKGQDAYATIASVAYDVPYEQCLEFNPETHEYQPDGKARRSESKSILLGEHYVMLSGMKLSFLDMSQNSL